MCVLRQVTGDCKQENKLWIVGFDVPTTVLLRIKVLWDVKLCCWLSSYQQFKRSKCLHLQGLSSPRRIQYSLSFIRYCLNLNMKALLSFEMLETTYPVTQHHTPKDLNPPSKSMNFLNQVFRYSDLQCETNTWGQSTVCWSWHWCSRKDCKLLSC
jgi:hypothetical protein